MTRSLIALLAVLLLPACGGVQTIQSAFQSKGEQALAAGLRHYEAGEYPDALKSFQEALEAGLSAKDQVDARKHLAFIHCASGRQAPCRDEFRKALDVDPKMELDPAEAGHPRWGPVFRMVKASYKAR